MGTITIHVYFCARLFTSNRTIALWYDDGNGGQRQGIIPEGSDTSTNSYDGHVFCFAEVCNQMGVFMVLGLLLRIDAFDRKAKYTDIDSRFSG